MIPLVEALPDMRYPHDATLKEAGDDLLAGARHIADYGTIQLYREVPPTPRALIFASKVSLGADNFRCWLINRNNRRAGRANGVAETWKNVAVWEPHKFNIEAFAPTRAGLEQIVADYLARYPSERYETRFCAIWHEEFDGWSVAGERLREPKEVV